MKQRWLTINTDGWSSQPSANHRSHFSMQSAGHSRTLNGKPTEKPAANWKYMPTRAKAQPTISGGLYIIVV